MPSDANRRIKCSGRTRVPDRRLVRDSIDLLAVFATVMPANRSQENARELTSLQLIQSLPRLNSRYNDIFLFRSLLSGEERSF